MPGGVPATPIAALALALAVRRLPGRPLIAVVGAAVSLLAFRSLLEVLEAGGGWTSAGAGTGR